MGNTPVKILDYPKEINIPGITVDYSESRRFIFGNITEAMEIIMYELLRKCYENTVNQNIRPRFIKVRVPDCIQEEFIIRCNDARFLKTRKIELRIDLVAQTDWNIDCDGSLCNWTEKYATDSIDIVNSWDCTEIEGLLIVGINYIDIIQTISMFRANKQPGIIVQSESNASRNYGFLIKVCGKVQNPLYPISTDLD